MGGKKGLNFLESKGLSTRELVEKFIPHYMVLETLGLWFYFFVSLAKDSRVPIFPSQ